MRISDWSSDVCSSDLFGRVMKVDPERAYTQAPALVGQGCARDLMMEGLLKLPDEILCMIKAQIHDEIVLSIPMRDAREVCDLIKRTMSFEWAPPGASRPIRIEVDRGDRKSTRLNYS